MSYGMHINTASYIKKELYHYVIHENAATINFNDNEKQIINNRLNSVEANYKIYIEAQNYKNNRIRNLARNLFYINFGELMAVNNVELELIKTLKK